MQKLIHRKIKMHFPLHGKCKEGKLIYILTNRTNSCDVCVSASPAAVHERVSKPSINYISKANLGPNGNTTAHVKGNTTAHLACRLQRLLRQTKPKNGFNTQAHEPLHLQDKTNTKKGYRFNEPPSHSSTHLGSNCNYSELSASDGNIRLPPVSLRRRNYFAGGVLLS